MTFADRFDPKEYTMIKTHLRSWKADERYPIIKGTLNKVLNELTTNSDFRAYASDHEGKLEMAKFIQHIWFGPKETPSLASFEPDHVAALIGRGEKITKHNDTMLDALKATPLYWQAAAAGWCCTEAFLDRLMSDGASINCQDDLGRTALHWAVGGPQMIVEDWCALPSKVEHEFFLELWKLASVLDDKKQRGAGIARLLENHGANPNLANIEGSAPLHKAIQFSNISAIHALLDHEADPNLRSMQNFIPLRLAAFHNNSAAFKLLLERGAKLDVGEESGQTP